MVLHTKVFHTVNNGFYIEDGDTGIFFDGIHKGHDYGFSDTPEEIIDKCYALEPPFEKLKALFFTHRHEDHFDPASAEVIIKRNKLLFYMPKTLQNTVSETLKGDGISEINVGSMRIYAIKTIHDGKKELRREPHVSFAVNTSDESFFLAGDAAFQESETDKIQGCILHRLKAAFVNPYQMLSNESRGVLSTLKPEKLILAHMPFEKDDTYDVKKLYEEAMKRCLSNGTKPVDPGYVCRVI
jgi:L-ascorbate metabolism protein UlaG (beta-lactamase superfamily)